MRFFAFPFLATCCILLTTIFALADPPQIVTAPKGVKAIHRGFYQGYQGKKGEFYKWSETISEFDANGRLIRTHTEYSEKESWMVDVEEKFSYKLDESGRVLAKTRMLNGEIQQVWRYEYQPDGSFAVTEWAADLDGGLREDPEEVWQFDESGRPLSMESTDLWGRRTVRYEYANWLQPDRRHPTNGNGRLISIYSDYYRHDVQKVFSHSEDFRVYTKDNRLEILYGYDDHGFIVTKTEYDEREEPKGITWFVSQTKEDGSLAWSVPVSRVEQEHACCKLHGLELRDWDTEALYNYQYQKRSEDDWRPDYSQAGTENLTVIKKYVYQYEFTEEFLSAEGRSSSGGKEEKEK